MDKRRLAVATGIWFALVAAGAGLRIALVDWPNFAPVAALALFAGFYFRRPLVAGLVPVTTMVASDLVIGGYHLPLMLTVYGALTAPTLLGLGLRRAGRLRAASSLTADGAGVVGCCLLSSIFFFLVTNFAVWATSSVYDGSWSSLMYCYARAIPFFRYTLEGDLFFGVLVFGTYLVAVRSVAPAKSPAPASTIAAH